MPRNDGKEALVSKPVSLKELARHLKLSTATVSVVLNDSPTASAIPQKTKDRILAAAVELNYRPNFFARTLRRKRTFTIGVMVQDFGDPYVSLVLSGIEKVLREANYFFLAISHRHRPNLIHDYAQLLLERGVEGYIGVGLRLEEELPLPATIVSGHRKFKGVTNIVLDHNHAARLALGHLQEAGHERIAFIRGQPFSADSADRWQNIVKVAQELGQTIDPELVAQLQEEIASPEIGYPAMKKLLATRKPFTALFAYDDIAAIGSIRALHDAGLRVPQDVAVVGFDDIQTAAYYNPSLTTVRQPLQRMGEIAAHTLIAMLDGKSQPEEIAVEPELVVRESTGARSAAAVQAAAEDYATDFTDSHR
jgi:DNA-binding LacI/PurR family transcriptional regulator